MERAMLGLWEFLSLCNQIRKYDKHTRTTTRTIKIADNHYLDSCDKAYKICII